MLHNETLEPGTLELLIRLMQEPFLRDFVLVGGTALALQIGHRKSDDLDFFTTIDFETNQLLPLLLEKYAVRPVLQMPQTLICFMDNIKVDFIRFRYPFIRPFVEVEGIRMLSIDDIAGMKLDAITGRGKKKDFYDLYYLLQNYTLEGLLKLYLEKYPHQTTLHVARSLTYFEDAEADVDPISLDKSISWKKVKKTITEQVRHI
jgi:predicted nucleotidyltransferase component of viral defense system